MSIKNVIIEMDDGRNFLIEPEYINSITMETNIYNDTVSVRVEFIAPEALIAYGNNSKMIEAKLKLLSGA